MLCAPSYAAQRGGILPWLLCLTSFASLAGGYFFWFMPLERVLAAHEDALARSNQDLSTLQRQLAVVTQQKEALEAARISLLDDLTSKDAHGEDLDGLEAALGQALKERIAAGLVDVRQERGAVVLDMTDSLAFARDESLSDDAHAVINAALAAAEAKAPMSLEIRGYSYHVRTSARRGHQPMDAWGTSAEHALAVARAVELTGRLDTARLMASCVADHRPILHVAGKEAERRNRRVELRFTPSRRP